MNPTHEQRQQALLARMASARQEAAEIAAAIEFYGALIAVLIDEDARVEAPALDGEAVSRKFAAGDPLLHGESLGMDEAAIRDLLLRLCGATEAFGKVPADINPRRLSWFQNYRAERDPAYARGVSALSMRLALDDGRLDFGAVMDHLMSGDDAALTALSESAGLDPDLTATLARFAMRPAMAAFAAALEPLVRAQADRWGRGDCPVCGSPPVLSEYDEQAQKRHLRCATCGTSWPYPWLRCVHCGNDNAHTLSFVQMDGDLRHQADVCTVCNHYLKSVRTTEPLNPDLLPIEDLVTLAIDTAAQEEGYAKL